MGRADTGLTQNPRPRRPLIDRLVSLLSNAAANSQCAVPVAPEPPKIPTQQILVLVVDDDPANLLLASDMLSWLGINAQLATDGTEAVALACKQRLDLILMDLQMPALDGLGATRQIRRFEQEHELPRVPVVAYTSTDVSRKSLEAFGIDDLLEKPCALPALEKCLQQWCAPAKTSGGLAPPALQHLRP